MIDRDENSVGWAMMMYELEDAHEHMRAMLKDIEVNLNFSEEEFRIHLGHVYAHLNRAWRRRLIPGQMTDNEWEAGREFPNDIQPIA